MKIKGLPTAASFKASVLAKLFDIDINTARKLKAGATIEVKDFEETLPTVGLYEVIESKPEPTKRPGKEKT